MGLGGGVSCCGSYLRMRKVGIYIGVGWNVSWGLGPTIPPRTARPPPGHCLLLGSYWSWSVMIREAGVLLALLVSLSSGLSSILQPG